MSPDSLDRLDAGSFRPESAVLGPIGKCGSARDAVTPERPGAAAKRQAFTEPHRQTFALPRLSKTAPLGSGGGRPFWAWQGRS
jgi:hypothetical protein